MQDTTNDVRNSEFKTIFGKLNNSSLESQDIKDSTRSNLSEKVVLVRNQSYIDLLQREKLKLFNFINS